MARVLSCRFMRLSCSEDDHPLFRRYYARCNRHRGIKLLRCFPHCCPEHVQRCYCGTSIHVEVVFAAPPLPSVDQNGLLVCARFEPTRVVPLWPTTISDTPRENVVQANERKLQPGEVVTLPASLLAAERRKLSQTVWIRADKEGDLKHRTLSQNTVLYVLNNHRFPKWQYSYDSSVTRTQREMTHHLVAYVFQLMDSTSQLEGIEAMVLARNESPGFSLFSYRRSGNNVRDVGCDLHALESASSPRFAALEVDASTSLLSSAMRNESSKRKTENFEARADNGATNQSPDATFESASADSDAAFWAYDIRVHRSGLAEKAKHLLILWQFLSFVTLSDMGMTSNVLKIYIRTHWLRTAEALRASLEARTSRLEGVMGSFLLSLCKKIRDLLTNQSATREQVVIQAAVNLLLRALSSQAIQCALQSAFAAKSTRLYQGQVRERFIVLVLDLYDIIGDLLQLGSSYEISVFPGSCSSVPALVDEVLSIIYSQRHYFGLKSEITGLVRADMAHPGPIECLYGCFTAQMQEHISAAGSEYNISNPFVQMTGISEFWRAWNRTWLLDPGSMRIASIIESREITLEPSLVEFLRWIYEFACVEVATNGFRLIVRSVLPMINGMVATELVLDGHLRAFHLTPSGVSTKLPTAGGWWVRDYAGRFSDQSNMLEIDFYALKGNLLGIRIEDRTRCTKQRENNTFVYRVSMTLMLEEHDKAGDPPNCNDFKDRSIFIRGIVAQATYTDNFRFEAEEMSTTIRSVILRELPWIAELEVRGGYVAVPS